MPRSLTDQERRNFLAEPHIAVLSVASDDDRADLDSDAIKKAVARDLADGDKAGVEGTPTVFINGQRFNGELALDSVRPVIEAELKRVAKR